MQINRIEKKLRKINRLIDLFKVDGRLSKIEKDLLLDYVRKLYEELIFDDENNEEENHNGNKQNKATKKNTKTIIKEIEQIEEDEEEVEQLHVFEQPVVAKVEVAEVVTPQVEPVIVSPPVVESKIKNYPELFALDEIIDLSGKLSMTKITDINKVIGINERIFTIKELFGGDNQVYSEAINTLNNSNDFESAKRYLSTEIIERFDWNQDDKVKKAQNFIKIVSRLFV